MAIQLLIQLFQVNTLGRSNMLWVSSEKNETWPLISNSNCDRHLIAAFWNKRPLPAGQWQSYFPNDRWKRKKTRLAVSSSTSGRASSFSGTPHSPLWAQHFLTQGHQDSPNTPLHSAVETCFVLILRLEINLHTGSNSFFPYSLWILLDTFWSRSSSLGRPLKCCEMKI